MKPMHLEEFFVTMTFEEACALRHAVYTSLLRSKTRGLEDSAKLYQQLYEDLTKVIEAVPF